MNPYLVDFRINIENLEVKLAQKLHSSTYVRSISDTELYIYVSLEHVLLSGCSHDYDKLPGTSYQ